MITLGNSESGAVFSDCRRYRYRLWRVWDHELPRVCCILLNPSTADEIKNDATIERRVRHVMHWMQAGYDQFGSVEIINAFAFRATDPNVMRKADDPVGPENDGHIEAAARTAMEGGGMVLCGWGGDGLHLGRQRTLLRILRDVGWHEVAALKLNGNGTPAHPLYLGYDLLPRWWTPGATKLGGIAV
jgi:hypothetical protein